MQRKDYLIAWLVIAVVLLITSPWWLILLVGLVFPLLIACIIVAIPIGVIVYALRK